MSLDELRKMKLVSLIGKVITELESKGMEALADRMRTERREMKLTGLYVARSSAVMKHLLMAAENRLGSQHRKVFRVIKERWQ